MTEIFIYIYRESIYIAIYIKTETLFSNLVTSKKVAQTLYPWGFEVTSCFLEVGHLKESLHNFRQKGESRRWQRQIFLTKSWRT